jgi:hypothetical protein
MFSASYQATQRIQYVCSNRHVPTRWGASGPIRNPRAHWCGRQGRGLSRASTKLNGVEQGEGILAVRLAAADLDEVRKQIGQKNVAKEEQSVLVSPENAASAAHRLMELLRAQLY